MNGDDKAVCFIAAVVGAVVIFALATFRQCTSERDRLDCVAKASDPTACYPERKSP